MTLRKLWLMAQSRQELEGYLAAFTAAVVVGHLPLTATKLNPRELNPFGHTDPELRKKIDEAKRYIASVAIAARADELKRLAQGG